MSVFLMGLLLISVILLVAACVYPFSILALLLQFVFFILSLYVYSSKRKKKKKSFRTFIATASHGLFLILVTLAFVYISLPSREEGDIDSVTRGVKKLFLSKFGLDDDDKQKTHDSAPSKGLPEALEGSQPQNSSKTIDENINQVENEVQKPEAPEVKDPF